MRVRGIDPRSGMSATGIKTLRRRYQWSRGHMLPSMGSRSRTWSRRGEVTAAELAATARAAIDAVNPRGLNAAIGRIDAVAEEALTRGPPEGAPFSGVPFLIKDIGMDYANIRTKWGALGGTDLPARHRARRSLQAGGAGHPGTYTNTPEFGCNASTEPVSKGQKPQSVEPGSQYGRLLGRKRRGGGGGGRAVRPRERRRWIDPGPGLVLRAGRSSSHREGGCPRGPIPTI